MSRRTRARRHRSSCACTSREDDVGKVIGRGGRIVRALRTRRPRERRPRGPARARRDRRVTGPRDVRLRPGAGGSSAEARARGRRARRAAARPRRLVRRRAARASDPERFAVGARLLRGGASGEVVVASKRAGGRLVIRLDRRGARGDDARGAAARRCRRTGEDELLRRSSSSGSTWSRRADASARARRATSLPGVANDVARARRRARLLPLVGGLCPRHRPRSGTNRCRARLLRPRTDARLQHRRLHPGSARVRVAHRAASGRGRARRRSSSCGCSPTATTRPLRAGQVDDEPYGGGAGHGAARRRRRRGARRRLRRPAGPPRGRADAAGPAARRRPSSRSSPPSRAADAPLRALRGLRRAHRRAPRHRLDLDRPVRALERRPAGDGARSTRSRGGCPGALAEGSASWRASRRSSTGGLEYPHYTRPAEFRGWRVPDVLLSGDHAQVERWRASGAR